MKTLSIILARGGSKGIPGKNTMPIAHVPLIARTVRAAVAATYVDGVFVSTDDPLIADIAQREGATIINRPADISGDQASSESALLHALDELATAGIKPEVLVFLQCTSPFTTAEDIDAAIEKFHKHSADSLFSGYSFFHFVWKIDEDGSASGLNHDKSVRPRRQERQGQFCENGAIYVMRTEGFLRSKHRFFGKTICYEMPAARSLEIDEPHDLAIAETFARLLESESRAAALPESIDAIIFDFDGVFTDNKVHISETGVEHVTCSRGDGMGIEMLRFNTTIPLRVLSKEQNPVVKARCEKLKLPCEHGVEDKLTLLQELIKKEGWNPAYCLYLGNDLNDISCMAYVGCPIAVNDAPDIVKRYARFVLTKNGGNGAVRELADLILDHLKIPVEKRLPHR